ncbi:MAG: putative bifunctional diguanylate cyclase/phosphodiesterase [Acidimicrobiia bacterium]
MRVGALTVAMLAAATLFVLAIPDPFEPTVDTDWWFVVVIALSFGLLETAVFNVMFRRHGISFSLSEIPLALSLVFISPLLAIAVRWSCSAPVLVLRRRNRGAKLAFNLTLFVFELMLAYLVFRGLLSWWGDSAQALIAGSVIAPTASAITTSVLISTAISAYEGGLRERIVTELAGTWWLYPVTSVLGAMTLGLALVEPLLALFAVLPGLGIWYVLYSFGVVNQTLRDLNTLHGFTDRVGTSLDPEEIGEVAVDELFDDLRVTGVALVRFGDDTVRVDSRGDVPVRLPTAVDDATWHGLLSERRAQIVPPDHLRRLGVLDDRSLSTPVLVAGLWEAGEIFGVIVAIEQWTILDQFAEAERARLDSMASQLAVSLRRAILHQRLEHEARHDALTGLPARTLFERAVDDAIASERAGFWAVMMLDLDRFKEVNDTLGHHAGDALLVEFSRRMLALLGPDDVLARLAGDEFAILCHRATSDEVLDTANAVVRSGGSPVTLDGLEIVVTVSVGLAEITDADDDPLQPMRRADIAMYNAKWQRTGVELYRDEIDRRTPARLSMLGDLRSAIEEDHLDVVYQPKLDLGTGVVTGAEALVRWEHATRGVVAPTEFVRVAEDTGLIKDLTDLVLARGIRALRGFEEHGLGIGLAVNLSTHDLFDGRLPHRVRGYLDSNGVRPESLTLEITESSLLVDAPRTRATIDELHAVGLLLAVDDFGTGYSSLSYLRRLPVQELKIDQSFVNGMLDDPQDEVIVRSTIDLGHNLGLKVVAEGVESLAVLDKLRDFGCDVAQGYAIAQPMSADELVAFVLASRAEQPTPVSPA